jgi:hypothetical protein
MIERTLLASCVMGLVGFATFWWLLRSGWSEGAARNALLLHLSMLYLPLGQQVLQLEPTRCWC